MATGSLGAAGASRLSVAPGRSSQMTAPNAAKNKPPRTAKRGPRCRDMAANLLAPVPSRPILSGRRIVGQTICEVSLLKGKRIMWRRKSMRVTTAPQSGDHRQRGRDQSGQDRGDPLCQWAADEAGD